MGKFKVKKNKDGAWRASLSLPEKKMFLINDVSLGSPEPVLITRVKCIDAPEPVLKLQGIFLESKKPYKEDLNRAMKHHDVLFIPTDQEMLAQALGELSGRIMTDRKVKEMVDSGAIAHSSIERVFWFIQIEILKHFPEKAHIAFKKAQFLYYNNDGEGNEL